MTQQELQNSMHEAIANAVVQAGKIAHNTKLTVLQWTAVESSILAVNWSLKNR